MALIYLLDTNIISELEKQSPSLRVQKNVSIYMQQCALSATSWHEMWHGYHLLPSSKRKLLLKKFLDETVQKLVILPYDEAAAEWHAQERGRLSKMGRTPSYPDGQIAAVAAANNLVIVTRNVKDFADFQDIVIENWFEEG